MKVRTNFHMASSFYDNREFFSTGDVVQISIHCLEASAPGGIRAKWSTSVPTFELNFRSLGLICPNLRPIYQLVVDWLKLRTQILG
jgi:hypothetical protein